MIGMLRGSLLLKTASRDPQGKFDGEFKADVFSSFRNLEAKVGQRFQPAGSMGEFSANPTRECRDACATRRYLNSMPGWHYSDTFLF